jgi:hypothetical protein
VSDLGSRTEGNPSDLADASVDHFIARREAQRERMREPPSAQKLALLIEAQHLERVSSQRARNRLAWYRFHQRQIAVHEGLAQHHRERLGRLLDYRP